MLSLHSGLNSIETAIRLLPGHWYPHSEPGFVGYGQQVFFLYAV
jgi:hypothetical protein